MFQLTKIEAQNLRFQFGTSSSEYGGRRYLPYAFTQEGVAMLSGVLRSPKAIQVNVSIMRAFVRLRSILAEHKDLARKIEEIDKKYEGKLTKVLELINKYLKPAALPKPKGDFGFRDKR